MAKKIVNKVKKFLCEEDGMGVIEVVLIVLVLVGLAFLFKTQITMITTNVLESIRLQVERF